MAKKRPTGAADKQSPKSKGKAGFLYSPIERDPKTHPIHKFFPAEFPYNPWDDPTFGKKPLTKRGK